MKLVLVLLSALLSVATYAKPLRERLSTSRTSLSPSRTSSPWMQTPFLSVEMSPPKTELSK